MCVRLGILKVYYNKIRISMEKDFKILCGIQNIILSVYSTDTCVTETFIASDKI